VLEGTEYARKQLSVRGENERNKSLGFESYETASFRVAITKATEKTVSGILL